MERCPSLSPHVATNLSNVTVVLKRLIDRKNINMLQYSYQIYASDSTAELFSPLNVSENNADLNSIFLESRKSLDKLCSMKIEKICDMVDLA